MKQNFLKQLAVFIFLCGLPAALMAKTIPPQLSADLTMFQKNKVFDQGKIYIGKTAARLDWQEKMKQTQIFHFDSDKIEAWMHKGNLIVEMKMQYNPFVHELPEGFKEECGGQETLDGHPCQKCKISGTFMGKKVNTTVWRAKDIQMFIKSEDEEGNGMTIKNIALGSQSATLFQAPAGYRKMSLPSFGDIFKTKSN